MREIKFRAWDEKSKKIYNITHLSFMRNSDGTAEEMGCEGYYGDNHRSKLCLDNIKLMQYTGLKDKNGKEIYEGDICNLGSGRNTRMWVIRNFIEDSYHLKRVMWEENDEAEIIGNIYENPELIK